MSSRLPESTRLAYARQLADEAKTLVPGMERLSAIAEELRADDLYRLLGFDTWERFCADYLGVSKRTANRWIAGPKKPASVGASDTDQPKSIGAGQSVAAGQNVPVVESKALNSAKPLAGGSGKAATSAVSKPGIDVPGSAPPPADPSSGGAGATATPPRRDAPTEEPSASRPAPPDPNTLAGPGETSGLDGSSYPASGTPERLPSDRQLAARVYAAMREVDPTDAGPVTTPEEATFLRQWAQRTLDAWKAVYAPPASAEKPQRRQGTITRPADRGVPTINGSLTRREVTPMFKP